jgi:hypothetical protein
VHSLPEYKGKKITRAQESARHSYRRALEKAVRLVSKGSGWKSIEGCLFREQSGWFVSVAPAVFIHENVTKANIQAKPMSIDPIFWDIVGLPENRDLSLSFRLSGAWTCRGPYVGEVVIDESEDASVVAERILSIANKQLEKITRKWSKADFLHHCQKSSDESDHYLPCIVTALIALGRPNEALNACILARQRGNGGGFLAPEGSFTDMAITWIETSIANATRH